MTADDLIVDPFQHVIDRELAFFTCNLGIQHDLQEQVAKLLAHGAKITRIDGSNSLI